MGRIWTWLRAAFVSVDLRKARVHPDGGPGEFFGQYPWEE